MNTRQKRLIAGVFGPSGEGLAAVSGLLIVLVIVMGAAVGLDRLAFDAWSGILTLTVLVALTIPALNWLARREGDPRLARMLMWGMVATVAGVLVRYFFVTVVYNDSSDAGRYSTGAGELARLLKQGSFTTIPPGLEAFPPETQRIGLVLGFVYLITGTSRWAGSIVFAWFAFGGRLLLWRALRRAVPEADDKRYLMFLLFFPSLIYWPASIGKEALMFLALGVLSFAAASVLVLSLFVSAPATGGLLESPWDKLVHFGFFGCVTFLLAIGFGRRPVAGRAGERWQHCTVRCRVGGTAVHPTAPGGDRCCCAGRRQHCGDAGRNWTGRQAQVDSSASGGPWSACRGSGSGVQPDGQVLWNGR